MAKLTQQNIKWIIQHKERGELSRTDILPRLKGVLRYVRLCENSCLYGKQTRYVL